jgi:hypothetical protein
MYKSGLFILSQYTCTVKLSSVNLIKIMSLDYRAWIRAAKERLSTLENQRRAIDDEMAALEKSIRAFEPLVNVAPLDSPEQGYLHPAYIPASNLGWLTGGVETRSDVGLTDAIRGVLMAADRPLEPTEVRDLIVRNGFSLSGRSNAMANIHQVLRRLVSQSEVQEVVEIDEASRRKSSGPNGAAETWHGKVRFQWKLSQRERDARLPKPSESVK